MDTVLTRKEHNLLPLSLRLIRLILGVLLLFAVMVEMSISSFWQVILTLLAIYVLITGVFGRDPLFAALRLSIGELPDYTLGVVAQLECFSIGLICIVAGVMNYNPDSMVTPILPFLGIYPILLCAVKHDLLGYLLHSYRKALQERKTE